MTWKIVEWRKRKNLSREHLARRSRIRLQTLWAAELGAVDTRPKTIEKIARGLGISVEQLRHKPE